MTISLGRSLCPVVTETSLRALPNKALQQTGLSVASLPLAPAAERRYVGQATS